jgi:low temperature requirement protein LtrA
MPGMTDEPADGPVSTLELFFDLVFVFAVTQLTSVLVAEPNWLGAGRVLVVFVLVWWMYGGYGWLTNAVPPDRKSVRLLLLAGMAGFLVLALSIPAAFGRDGLAFGLAYLFLVVLHAAVFNRAQPVLAHTMSRFSPFNVGSALLLVLASQLAEPARATLWVVAIVLQWISPFFTPIQQFRIRVGHIVERYGLVLIIVLGESVVAIGLGAEGLPIGPGLLLTVVLALGVSAGLWWLYFIGEADRAERALQAQPPERRTAMVFTAFFYAQVPMLLGVVCLAAGVKKTIGHPFHPVGTAAALFLAGGVALYLTGGSLFRLAVGAPGSAAQRAVMVLPALGTGLIGVGLSGVAELAALLGVLLAAAALDHRRRDRDQPGSSERERSSTASPSTTIGVSSAADATDSAG